MNFHFLSENLSENPFAYPIVPSTSEFAELDIPVGGSVSFPPLIGNSALSMIPVFFPDIFQRCTNKRSTSTWL